MPKAPAFKPAAAASAAEPAPTGFGSTLEKFVAALPDQFDPPPGLDLPLAKPEVKFDPGETKAKVAVKAEPNEPVAQKARSKKKVPESV